MGKIITVTLNPAIDKIMEIDHFQPGTVCNARNVCTYPAGKGINVSRAIGCMERPTLAIGWIGKENVPFFNTLQTEYVQTRWILSDHPTRTNLTIHDNGIETHIRENQTIQEEFPSDEIIQTIQEQLEDNDLIVISGSLPAHAPATTLKRVLQSLKDKAYLILDSSGAPMKEALSGAPDLIKPNLDELAEMTGQKHLDTDLEIKAACKTLAAQNNIETIVVSLGKEGALLYHHPTDATIKAQLDLQNWSHENNQEPLPRTLNTVGCGDSMVAGICVQLTQSFSKGRRKLQSEDLQAILKAGIALGTANLFNDMPGSVHPATVDSLKEAVQIQTLDL